MYPFRTYIRPLSNGSAAPATARLCGRCRNEVLDLDVFTVEGEPHSLLGETAGTLERVGNSRPAGQLGGSGRRSVVIGLVNDADLGPSLIEQELPLALDVLSALWISQHLGLDLS